MSNIFVDLLNMDGIFLRLSSYKKRNIPETLITEILSKPQKIIDQNGKKVYQSIVFIDGSKFLVMIFVNTQKKPNVVITVYLTSKISKYWREQ